MLNTHHIEVSRSDDGIYLIESDADIGTVDLHVATNPHELSPPPLLTGQSFPIRVEGLDRSARYYFHLRSPSGDLRAVAERALPLQGGTNFRDFGGYRTSDGRQVRWGRLFRSGHMTRLTDDDVALLRTLDIRCCCDFRRVEEQENAPSRLPAGIEILALSVDPGSVSDFFEHLNAGRASADDMARFMGEINAEFVVHHQPVYRQVMDTLADLEEGALLINCTAGKDRTGFGAAMILLALGVPRETVLYDYMLSQRYYPIERELDRVLRTYASELDGAWDQDLVRPMMETRLEYLQKALDTIDAEYGDPDSYLEQALGLDAQKRERLRENLTVPLDSV